MELAQREFLLPLRASSRSLRALGEAHSAHPEHHVDRARNTRVRIRRRRDGTGAHVVPRRAPTVDWRPRVRLARS